MASPSNNLPNVERNAMCDLESFVKLQTDLLVLEKNAELDRAQALRNPKNFDSKELEKKGIGLRRMVTVESKIGLYGKTIIVFSKERSEALPATSITNGDIVGMFRVNQEQSEVPDKVPSGIVTQVTPMAISVAFEEGYDALNLNDDDYFNLVKLANDVTHRRLKNVLELVNSEKDFSTLHHALFGRTSFSPPLQSLHPKIQNPDGTINFLNKNLNTSQQEAVQFCLLQKELAIVHGPPGTGKTTTVVEIILQEVLQGHKVLCCAPSNVAVDNLLDKLSKHKIRVLRLGHPARLTQDLQIHSLDAILSGSDGGQLVEDVRNDLNKAISNIKRSRNEGERRRLQSEIKSLRKELREREIKSSRDILSRADVVLSTLTSASTDGPLRNLPKDQSLFDVSVIDECSQALEMSCWIALLQSKKAILAGDHLQLPPTIMSTEAAKKGLSFTLMERAIELFGNEVVRMLKTQYRMNKAIMQWSSEKFYNNELVADVSVESHLLKDLKKVKSDENTEIPLVLIDTSGCDMYEVEAGDDISKANEGEVSIVCVHAEQLIENGVSPDEIAIITPYNLQVELIRLQLSEKYPNLEIRSVDGFQGREKEAVILSLVRSNNKGEVGFLSEHRRLNVAVTRAKRHVAVICNVDCISHDPVLKSFAEYFINHGEVRSPTQYEHLSRDIIRPQGMELTLIDAPSVAKKVDKPKAKDNKRKNVIKNETSSNKKVESTNKNHSLPKPSLVDEEELFSRKEELKILVVKFIESTEQILRCSFEFNALDRKLIHEIAEELDLFHESQGEGLKRQLVLSKQEFEQPQKVPHEQPTAKITSSNVKREDVVTCSTCQREVPRSNILLHKTRCEVVKKVNVTIQPKVKTSKKKEVSDKDEEDIDSLLESFSKLDNVCNYEKCKKLVKMLGVTCQFCATRFCLEHGLPEAHGCGDAARRAARQQISRDGQLYSGSGRPDKKPDAVRKAQLQRKLDKKMSDLEDQRKSKPKKS